MSRESWENCRQDRLAAAEIELEETETELRELASEIGAYPTSDNIRKYSMLTEAVNEILGQIRDIKLETYEEARADYLYDQRRDDLW